MDDLRFIALSSGILAAMEAQRSAERVVIKQRRDEADPVIFTPHLDRDPRTKGQRRYERRQQLRSVMKR